MGHTARGPGAYSRREQRLNVGMTADILVGCAPGDYWVGAFDSATAAFLSNTNADSGSNGFDVIYRCTGAPGTAKFYNGTLVTGWSLYSGSIYRAAVAGPLSGGVYVGTMWENGVRARCARTPAYIANANYPVAQAPYLTTAGVSGSQTVLQYTPGDLTPGAWDLASAQIVDWSGGLSTSGGSRSWFTDTIPVQSVNTGAHQLTLSATTLYPIYSGGVGSRYFAQGDLSMLTGPGQFYHDTTNGFLYYWPNATPIASQQIVIPTTATRAFEFVGASTASAAHHIVLDGLDVQFNPFPHTWQETGYTDAGHLSGLVYMENAHHVQVLNANLHNAGTYGVYGHAYAQFCTIANTWIHNIGSNAIWFENYPTISPDVGDVNTGHLISNIRANDVGELVGSGAGVYLLNVSNTTVEYVDIYNSRRMCIALIGAGTISDAKTYTQGNVFRYAKLTWGCQDSGDMGLLYFGEVSPDSAHPKVNQVNQVIVDHAFADPSMTDFPPAGVYMDAGAYGQRLQNIQVTNVQGSLFEDNSGGHTVINCSWVGGFNPALIDTANIGVTAGFPLPMTDDELKAYLRPKHPPWLAIGGFLVALLTGAAGAAKWIYSAPTQEDYRDLGNRTKAVELDHAVLKANVDGMRSDLMDVKTPTKDMNASWPSELRITGRG